MEKIKNLIYFDNLEKFFLENKIPRFRLKQLNDAYFKNFIIDVEKITNFPKKLREEIGEKFKLNSLVLENVLEDVDFMKFVLKTYDNNFIEVVVMNHLDKRKTICLSSQIFCPLNCKFCATGSQKFKRNLTFKEIVEQIIIVNSYLKKIKENDRITNVVFMGMGEPFLNYDNLIKSLFFINDSNYLNLGQRQITISTVGIVPKIYDFIKLNSQIKLAVSLHASSDNLRDKIMPINKKYPLSDLFKSLDEYCLKTNKRVSYEYILIKDLNDSLKDAKKIVDLLKNRLSFVNLIVFNPHKYSDFEKPDLKTVLNFEKFLKKNNIQTSIRHSFGNNLKGACGQLALDKIK